jgi:hypothetical protein
MTSTQAGGFSSLPTEMVKKIFQYVSTRYLFAVSSICLLGSCANRIQIRLRDDPKAVSPVNREWHNAIAPMMWEHMITDLTADSTKSLAALLNPRNDILPHVQHFTAGDVGSYAGGEDHLHLVIALYAKDRLKSFAACFDEGISVLTLQFLLQSQSQLRRLSTLLTTDVESTMEANAIFSQSQT